MTQRRLPHNFGGQARHSKEDRGPELYPTPAGATIALLRAESVPKKLWEPAAGMGHMASVLVRAGHDVSATDMYDYGKTVAGSPKILAGVDFRACADNQQVKSSAKQLDAIITNPPFSMAEEFVTIGLSLVPKVYVLARLAFLEGNKRSEIIDTKLSTVYPFVNRLPMMHRWVPGPTGEYVEWTGKKSSSQVPYAWFVFDRDRDPLTDTVMRRIRYHKTKPSA